MIKEALILLGDIVHQVQKERGDTALFLGCQDIVFSGEMIRQFQATDQILAQVKEAAQRWAKTDRIKSIDKLNYRLKKIASLGQYRPGTETIANQPYQIIHFYTYDIIAPLLEIMVEIAFFDTGTDSHCVSAYSNFLQWKERVGRERATGALGFSSVTGDDPELMEELKALIIEQGTYHKTFVAMASVAQQDCLDEVFNTSDSAPADKTIETVHQALNKSGAVAVLESMSAERWYQLMTEKMNALYQLEQLLVGTLVQNSSSAAEHSSATVACNIPGSSGVNAQAEAFLKTQPFFWNLKDSLFARLMQAAHTRGYKKGKILFLEREQPTRFYIILEGWVKLYKSSASGEETILQMLSSGDTVVGSAVFLNTPYPLSAQIAETATLVSFPASVICQLIRNNNELAVNMLNNISLRSQLLIQQVEMVRLKSATERVGWFLLKTLMAQSGHNKTAKNSIRLPYDKAVIASYLDMKPETFSRTLKRFRDQGFHVENDTIILPGMGRLCGYCDRDIAAICARSNTADCPGSVN